MKYLLLLLFFLLTASFATQKVTLELKWKHQFQFAGFYMAKEKGFYKDLGIDVDIKEIEKNSPVQNVVEGKVDFAIDDSGLVAHRLKGLPIVAMLAIFQKSPLVFLSLEESNIKTVKDMDGKVIEIPGYGLSNITLYGILNASGVDFKLKRPTYKLDDLLSGKTDIVSAYLSNEPFQIEKKGKKANIINGTSKN